jgi:outer membrane lipoprotein-sorting protein
MLTRKVMMCLFFVVCLFVSENVLALTWDELKAKIESKYADFSEEVKDMEIVMVSESKAMEEMGPSEIKIFKKDMKFRMETMMNIPGETDMPAGMEDMKNIIIFDGKDYWTINQFTGKQKLPSDANVSVKGQISWWEDLPEKGKIIGSEKVGIRDCYIVETWDEDNKENKIKGWVEKTTLLLVKMELEGEDGKTFTVLNSDFRKVKKWEMPYTIEVFAGGELMSKTNITTFNINNGLSDDLFDADKASEDMKTVPGMPDMKEMMKKFKMGG